MTLLSCVSKGKAFLKAEGLRCAAPRKNNEELVCNKLLCKKNHLGQIAGNFRCERCAQEIEVKLVSASEGPAAK